MMRRLLRGVLANAYGQGVAIAIQLLSVPVFIQAWGNARYGLWLVLAAVPWALSMADCGVTVTSGNAMTAAVARGDPPEAARLFAEATRFVATVILACMGSALLAAPLVLGTLRSSASLASPAEIAVAALALLCTTLVGLGLGVLDTAFRANRDYAFGFVAIATIRLIEACGALSAAALGGGLGVAAATMLALRLAGLGLLVVLVKRRVRWVRFRTTGPAWSGMRPLLRPALAALAVPAGLAVNLQGATIVAGLVLSLAAVPVFAATRTLTRVIVQGIGLFTHALMPEMASAAGWGDPVAVQRILRLNRLIGAWTLLPGWAALVLSGPVLMRLWTGGRLDVDPTFFAVMATAALCHGTWVSSANLLLATNRQAEYSFTSLVVAALTCIVAMVLGREVGLLGMAMASVAGEVLMVVLVMPKCLGSGGFTLTSASSPPEVA